MTRTLLLFITALLSSSGAKANILFFSATTDELFAGSILTTTSIQVPGFDPALGKLNSISLTLQVDQIESTVDWTFKNQTAGTLNNTFTTATDVVKLLSGSTVIRTLTGSSTYFQTSTPSQGTFALNGVWGASGSGTSSVSAANRPLFISPGLVTFTLTDSGLTNTQSAGLSLIQNTGLDGFTITVGGAYNYTPNPEPSALLLSGVGIILLVEWANRGVFRWSDWGFRIIKFAIMSPEQWQRVQQIFLQAEAVQGSARVQLLDQSCATDPELRRSVESMLEASLQSGDLLGEAVGVAARGFVRGMNSWSDPKTIGPYRILKPLGRGGMGAVYLATRADQQYEKQTAIKLMRAELDTPELRSRFRAERQILARLEHPNIARLLDGGATEDDLPYVVMEYVEGIPVTDYAQAHALSTNQRLHLFVTICEAVEYAHRNLVAHRDIKPANILVNSEGIPKLLDFGIARLVSSDTSDPHARTSFAERLMTPEFASPEQIRCEAVTTSTDIYSLGVLLYILLTGRPPYRTKDLSPSQVEKVICEQEAERPSVAVLRGELPVDAARQLNRELHGDLDHIVAMAMRKEPGARYSNVGLLIADIRLYLLGYPVASRKGAWTYGVGKFVRRHRIGVAVVSLFALMTVGFAISMAVLANRIRVERDTARREQRAQQQVSDYMVNLFGGTNTDQSRGKPLTALELLDRGVETANRDLQGQPEIHARLLHTMGLAYESLGSYVRSEALFQKSLDIRRGLGGGHTAAVAESLKSIAETFRLRSKFTEAEAAARESLEIRRALTGPENVDVADSLNTIGMVLWQKGDPAAAEPYFREALGTRSKLEGGESLGAAVHMSNLGGVLRAQGDLANAATLYRKVLELRTAKLGAEHPRTAISMNGLALVLESRGSYEESEQLFRQTLALRTKLLGAEHPDVLVTMIDLAAVLQDQAKYAEAEALDRKALALRVKSLGEMSRDAATCLSSLGSLLEETGKYPEALSSNMRALEIRKKVMGERNTGYARSLAETSKVLLDLGRVTQAEPMARQALEIRHEVLGPKHRDTAQSVQLLGRIAEARHELRQAESLYREALDIEATALEKDHPQRAETLTALGKVMLSQRRLVDAEPMLREALGIQQKKLPAGHPAIVETARALSRMDVQKAGSRELLESASQPGAH